MTAGVFGFLLRFFTEPTLGLPILLTGWAALAWALWGPVVRERRPPTLRRSWFPSDADLASYVYFALADGRYSRVLDAASGRLDEALRSRHEIGLAGLPLTSWGAERLGIPYARDLRQAGRALREARAAAVARESPIRVRWRFWLSPLEEEARFLDRTDLALAEAGRWIHDLEATP